MSEIQLGKLRPASFIDTSAVITMPSPGFSQTAVQFDQRLEKLAERTPTFIGQPKEGPRSLEEKLYDRLADFKIRTSRVAMHLDRDWRLRLFRQLDSLLDAESWEVDDPPPSLTSFATFLRMLVLLRPARRPGLGAAVDGNLIATWTAGEDHLTIECMAKDQTRWNLAATIDGDRERAAAITPIRRLKSVLSPYGPDRWFDYADNIPAT
jgi:hypothetical protein